MDRFYTDYIMNSYTILLIDSAEILQTQSVSVISGRNDKGDFMPIESYEKSLLVSQEL